MIRRRRPHWKRLQGDTLSAGEDPRLVLSCGIGTPVLSVHDELGALLISLIECCRWHQAGEHERRNITLMYLSQANTLDISLLRGVQGIMGKMTMYYKVRHKSKDPGYLHRVIHTRVRAYKREGKNIFACWRAAFGSWRAKLVVRWDETLLLRPTTVYYCASTDGCQQNGTVLSHTDVTERAKRRIVCAL